MNRKHQGWFGQLGITFLLTAAAIAAASESPARPQNDPSPQQRRRQAMERLEEHVLIKRDIVYGSDAPNSQNLDLYVPKDAGKPLPLVVWIHGGGFVGGSKRPTPAVQLLDQGFAAASIQYRFLDTAPWPAQIHDCKAAIRWLRAHAKQYNIDPERIGVWGGSAGGHLAALLGTTNSNKDLEGTVGKDLDTSSDVQAVCDWYGSSDLITMPRVMRSGKEETDKTRLLLGGPLSEKRELAQLVSPFYHADKKAVPFLIMHGDKDRIVPLEQSTKLHDKLMAAGTDSTLILMKGQGHGFRQPIRPVEEFFERTLKK